MYISCNLLKQYIGSNTIDWLSIWETFTTSTAEVEGVEVKGDGFKHIIVARIRSITPHPTTTKYSILSLDLGERECIVVTSATNIRIGMLTACCVNGGMINYKEVHSTYLDGILSEGVLCSEKELGISNNNTGIIDFPSNYQVGEDIKRYLNLDDIIVEIDNKSLTNRPDLWGHYGIAREICALTGVKLIEPQLQRIESINADNLSVSIDTNQSYVNRYTALKISNLSTLELSFNMKIILTYCGLGTSSPISDLCNYVMLEMGQPLFAFKCNDVHHLTIGTASKKSVLETMDGTANASENTIVTRAENGIISITGISSMLNSVPNENTTSIILESANYDAFSLRKSSLELKMRSEYSNRYEKSLDSELTIIEIRRFLFILQHLVPSAYVSSNLVDLYLNAIPKRTIELSKKKLDMYLGVSIESERVIAILSSLGMDVSPNSEGYLVKVPSFRATKDISTSADLIEEIARIYGYHNIIPKALELPLSIQGNAPTQYYAEYDLKHLLACKHNLHEVHTYLWNNEQLIRSLSLDTSDCLGIVNTASNRLIRNTMDTALVSAAMTNVHNYAKYGLFEVGTVYRQNEVKRQLGILLCDKISNAEYAYNRMKEIISSAFELTTNVLPTFKKSKSTIPYLVPHSRLDIWVKEVFLGYIGIVKPNGLGKDASSRIMVICNIDFDTYLSIGVNQSEYVVPSKYPTSTLDYTFILEPSECYSTLEEKLQLYSEPNTILSFSLIDTYILGEKKNITIRFTISRRDRTLQSQDITNIQNNLMSHFQKHDLTITQ